MLRRITLSAIGIAAVATSVSAAVPSSVAAPSGPDVAVVGEAILAGPATVAKAAAAPVPGCDDTSYALAKWKLASRFDWYYNAKGAPASVAATALTAINNGSQTVASGRNRCGATPKLTTTQLYRGTTTRVAQVSATGTCTGNDNQSVVSWGTLPSTYLAYTCVYYRPSTGAVLASDMLIDNRYHNWYTTQPAKCSNTFDLESVAVHERGHTAGLSHVDQTRSALQLMSPKSPACSTTKRLLAAGDLTGLDKLY
jgi:matrixin